MTAKQKNNQATKAEIFKALHHSEEMLVLPNVWDPLGALLLQELGYPAIATASASVALTNGYEDGEKIPMEIALNRINQIALSVGLPVSADFESGYANDENQLQTNIEMLIQTGAIGLNFEDYDKRTGTLLRREEQCKRIAVIRKTAERAGVPLFINARTDVYLRGKYADASQRLEDAMTRGKAYLDAGGDCFFVPGIKETDELWSITKALRSPVNVIALPGIPDFKTLREIGIARLSLGPGFLRIAIKAMKELALKLKNHEGIDDVLTNDVTSDYLKNLVNTQ